MNENQETNEEKNQEKNQEKNRVDVDVWNESRATTEIPVVNEVQVSNEIQEMLENQIVELNSLIEDQEQIILDLQIKLEASTNKEGRKSQVLDFLRSNGHVTIKDIANGLSISTKNVSSQLTYLRTDGYEIFTDNNGKKFLYNG